MSDYNTRLQELIESSSQDLELPDNWLHDFEPAGCAPSMTDESRMNQRLITKTRGLMWFEASHVPRSDEAVAVYTRDFSRSGVSFMSPLELFEAERVRVVLKSTWLELIVVRGQRVNDHCYEIGATVVQRHEPSMEAFDIRGASLVDVPATATVAGRD